MARILPEISVFCHSLPAARPKGKADPGHTAK